VPLSRRNTVIPARRRGRGNQTARRSSHLWLPLLLLVVGSWSLRGFASTLSAERDWDSGWGSLQTAASGRVGTPGRLALRVYNYARANSLLLMRTRTVVSDAFAEAGVEIVWIDCPVDAKAHPLAYAACQSNTGPNDLVVRILSRRMGEKLRAPNEPLGFAQVCPESAAACELNVFYDRVEQLAVGGYRPDLVLGYVIAHEAGHVLIGPGHSEQGIMRGQWSAKDLQRISWGVRLQFTGEQSSELRSAVLRRMPRPEQTSQSSALGGH
jgi:hypothetical protein